MTDHYDECLDARGLLCPEPLILARNKLRAMESGEILFITATDPSTQRDFANLCRFMGHRLVRSTTEGDALMYWLAKK